MNLGIALGGGGAKGFAHIGVLNALEQAGIEFDVVSGTSIGALVGAFYAAGRLSELEEATKRIKLSDVPLLLSPTFSRQGLFSGRKIVKFLNDYFEESNIEDLQKPFAAVSVDINKSEVVTFTKGNIKKAIRSSIAIPGVFTPVILDKKLLVDGGILDPLPIKAARDLGSDFIVAVDLFAHSLTQLMDSEEQGKADERIGPSSRSSISDYLSSITESISNNVLFGSKRKNSLQKKNIKDIIRRTSIVTQRRLTESVLKENPPDFIIQPDVTDFEIIEIHRARHLIEIGEHSAESVIPELRNLMTNKTIK